MKVLFLFADGAEQFELYYTHQYFTDRSATVDFACVKHASSSFETVISDFFKPGYKINCPDYVGVDFGLYDVLFVPGGLASSSSLRSSE